MNHRVRMDLTRGGYMDANVSPDVSPETLAALRKVGEAALTRMRDELAWLIERGQDAGQVPTVWVDTDDRSGSYGDWTEDANKARRFETRDDAQAYIEKWSIPMATAVEHGWIRRVAETAE